MTKIVIEWTSDDTDCECCGSSYADGANVVIDGELVIELIPYAHCCGGDHYPRDEVFKRILQHLGHEIMYD